MRAPLALFFCGCSSLYSPFASSNPDNCSHHPEVCAADQVCDESIGRCVPSEIVSPSSVDCSVSALVSALQNAMAQADNLLILTPSCTYRLTTVDNYWYGANALPPIASKVTIEGNGATIYRDDSSINMRFFFVAGPPTPTRAVGGQRGLDPGSLVLRNLTLQGGHAHGGIGGGSRASGGGGAGLGGAIFAQGQVTLQGVTLSDNQAEGGSGGAGSTTGSSGGGGLFGNGGVNQGGGGGFRGDGGNNLGPGGDFLGGEGGQVSATGGQGMGSEPGSDGSINKGGGAGGGGRGLGGRGGTDAEGGAGGDGGGGGSDGNGFGGYGGGGGGGFGGKGGIGVSGTCGQRVGPFCSGLPGGIRIARPSGRRLSSPLPTASHKARRTGCSLESERALNLLVAVRMLRRVVQDHGLAGAARLDDGVAPVNEQAVPQQDLSLTSHERLALVLLRQEIDVGLVSGRRLGIGGSQVGLRVVPKLGGERLPMRAGIEDQRSCVRADILPGDPGPD